MNAGLKNSFLTPKSEQRPQVQMCAVFVALILKFQLVISAERTSIFRPERAGWSDKIRLADLLKIHLSVDLHPQVRKSSRERETASFCSRLTPILQDKKHLTDDQNQNILKFF